jgi:membrane-bound lytic murein transglycosylase D
LVTETVRRGMRHVSLAAVVLAISACAHNPASRPVAQVAQQHTVGTLAPDWPSSTYPQPPTPPSAQSPLVVEPQAPEEPTQVAGLTPTQYADLFDRIRAGFKLEDHPDEQSIDEQLDWFASNPEYLQRAFGRSEAYLYHIATQLEARGMPLEIAFLPVVESAFEPFAYSRASASGLWQFIPGTGSRFGLKQDWWYDGRRDIVEATRAALDYLQALHDEFNGDWLLAIAAYNCGEMNVERAVDANRAAGKPIDFWNLRLPAETRAYVPKLLAMKRLVSDPETYGLSISPIPNQPYFARVDTHGQINLKLAAEIAGVTDEELYELNPAFHRWATDPTGPHFILLPVDGAQAFTENITQLTEEQRMGLVHYTVRRGDSVASVAKHFGTTVNVIRDLNGVPQGALTVGSDIRVPSSTAVQLPAKVMLAAARVDGKVRENRRERHVRIQVAHAGESLWSIARRHHINVNTLAKMNGMRPNDSLRAGQKIRFSASSPAARPVVARSVGDNDVATPAGSVSTVTASASAKGGSSRTSLGRRVVYIVRAGDTIHQIAKLFQVTVSEIMAWNGMGSGTHILKGQRLTIRVAAR